MITSMKEEGDGTLLERAIKLGRKTLRTFPGSSGTPCVAGRKRTNKIIKCFTTGQDKAGQGRVRVGKGKHFTPGRSSRFFSISLSSLSLVSLLANLGKLEGLALYVFLFTWRYESWYSFAIASLITQLFLTLARTIQTSCASLASPSRVFVFLHHSLLLCLRLLSLLCAGWGSQAL